MDLLLMLGSGSGLGGYGVPNAILGTVPGWITAGSMVTLLGLIFRHLQTMKKLALGDTSDIRDHYAREVERLTAKLASRDTQFAELEKHLRDMSRSSDDRHAECVREREALREELAGIKAQIRAASTDRVLFLEDRCAKPSEEAPQSLAAAQRLKEGGGK